MFFKITVVLSVILLAAGLSSRQIHKNEFMEVYEILDSKAAQPQYLEIQCRGHQVLSLKWSGQMNSPEYPRYDIHFKQDNFSLSKNHFTHLKNCQVDWNITLQPFKVEVWRRGSHQKIFSLNTVIFQKKHLEVRTQDPSQKWGLGERFQKDFETIDGTWSIWNRDRPNVIDMGSPTSSAQTYGHQPLYLARERQSKLYHLVHFKNVFAMNAMKLADDMTYHTRGGDAHFLIFIGQRQPEILLKKFHQFIGPGHIPPFWSMGWHQCRWGYRTIDHVKTVVDRYDMHQIPLDIVWTDLDYMNQKQDFTVDTHKFNLQTFSEVLKRVRYVPLIDAGVSINTQFAMSRGNQMNVFSKQRGVNYVGRVWPGPVHFVDFLHPNSSEYWVSMLKVLYDQVKFSGIWLDMNEPANFDGGRATQEPYLILRNERLTDMTIDIEVEHYNAADPTKPLLHEEVHSYYGHLETMATHRFFLQNKMRPFIITRANSVGTGRFAGHWTGDNAATWEFLRISINGNFLSQIFGMQMVGADICGFQKATTPQLCSRWLQLGSLYPFARSHNELQAPDQQPYALGEITIETAKQSLTQRYAIIKQYFSIFVKSKGLGSIFRPLFFEFPADEQCYVKEVAETQFLIGDMMMSAPIVYMGKQTRQAYFPGIWYEIESGSPHQGTVEIKNKLPSPPPLFLRIGYLMLMNMNPGVRISRIPNVWKMKVGLQKISRNFHTAKGFILSMSDYDKEEELSQCIQSGCFYDIQLELTKGYNLTISWTYQGVSGIESKINITEIELFFEDKPPILVKDISFIMTGSGSVNLAAVQGHTTKVQVLSSSQSTDRKPNLRSNSEDVEIQSQITAEQAQKLSLSMLQQHKFRIKPNQP